jgi:glutathione S-transferase
MATLFHHPFCPHSRFVRIALNEYGAAVDLVEERVWERRDAFLQLNPAGTTPVFLEEAGPPVPGAFVIAEYLDETRGLVLADRRLLPDGPAARVEVRRLANWFNEKFFAEVSEPLVSERIYRRAMTTAQGGGPPDTSVLRTARNNIRYHLAYLDWLVGNRNWLAGDQISYADLAAAAHLSVADYMGEVPWNEHETTKQWYARVKSRPSFRPILADALPGVPAAASYADLDF